MLASVILLGALYPFLGPGLRELDGSLCSEGYGTRPEVDINPTFLVLLLPSFLIRTALRRRPVYLIETFLYVLLSAPFLALVTAPECGSLMLTVVRDLDPMMTGLLLAWVIGGLLFVVSWVRGE